MTVRKRGLTVIAVCLSSAVILASFAISGGSKPVCHRIHSWFVWGNKHPAHPTEIIWASIPTTQGSTLELSGTVTYRAAPLGRRGRDLPMRFIDIGIGGLYVRIEDARHAQSPSIRAAADDQNTTLAIGIWGHFDAGDARVMDYLCLHFRPDEHIDIAVPFAMRITPDATELHGGSYSVTLADLHAEGEQRWNSVDRLWEPMFRADRLVRMRTAMVYWREGTEYATVSLSDADGPLSIEPRAWGEGTWTVRARGSELVCQALETGSANHSVPF